MRYRETASLKVVAQLQIKMHKLILYTVVNSLFNKFFKQFEYRTWYRTVVDGMLLLERQAYFYIYLLLDLLFFIQVASYYRV